MRSFAADRRYCFSAHEGNARGVSFLMPWQYGSLAAYKNRIEGGSFFPMITLSLDVLLIYMVFIPSQYDIKGSAMDVESTVISIN